MFILILVCMAINSKEDFNLKKYLVQLDEFCTSQPNICSKEFLDFVDDYINIKRRKILKDKTIEKIRERKKVK